MARGGVHPPGPSQLTVPAYLQTWTEGVDSARESAGQPLLWAGSNQYPRMGVEPGDRLFIVYLDDEDRRMHLIGRVLVAELITRAAAVRRRGPEIWEATHYAVADPASADRFVFDLPVPLDFVRRMRFERRSGPKTRLYPGSDGSLNGQALQAIRRLTPESEALLDALRGATKKRRDAAGGALPSPYSTRSRTARWRSSPRNTAARAGRSPTLT